MAPARPARNRWTRPLLLVLICAALPVALLVLLSLTARKPRLGHTDGRLLPCPDSPNCVCSNSEGAENVLAPLTFVDAPEAAMARLKELVEQMPGAHIDTTEKHYLRAEFTSKVFRFVDDVEFLCDPAGGEIHFRSASRSGYSDFGVNKDRIETIRRAFNGDATMPR